MRTEKRTKGRREGGRKRYGFGLKELAQLSEPQAIEILQQYGLLRKWKRCPYCRSQRFGLGRRYHWRCWRCRREWSPRKGSVLERFRIGYGCFLWTVKLFELGVPAQRAAEQLQLSAPTVYKLYRMIREVLQKAQQKEKPLGGEIEADETYIGGHRKRIRGRSRAGKIPVLGLRQRGGPLRLILLPDVSRATLHRAISRHVQPGSLIYIDSFRSYWGLGQKRWIHRILNKAEEGFRKGPICLNGVEGAWGWLKVHLRRFRGIPHRSYPLYLAEA